MRGFCTKHGEAKMYQKILVTLDHSGVDEAILNHIEQLHQYISSEVVLLHVAPGWAPRHFNELQLKESEEIREDRGYLARVEARLKKKGITATSFLAMG